MPTCHGMPSPALAGTHRIPPTSANVSTAPHKHSSNLANSRRAWFHRAMDTCSKCDQVAKWFVRDGSTIYFACGEPEHLRVHGIPADKWRAVGAVGGAALSAHKAGADIVKKILG